MVVSLIVTTLAIIITHWLYRWWNPKYSGSGKLPPGSSGLPVLGETIQFFKVNFTSDIHPFVKERMERYGPLFRTNIVGVPMIVSTDPEFNYFVFQQEETLFQTWLPSSFTKIVGKQNMSQLHGLIFKLVKNMVLDLFGPNSVKKMVPEVGKAALEELKRWSSLDNVEVKDGTSKMIFGLSAKKLISHDPEKSSVDLRDCYSSLFSGLISFPLNIPGTAYHKSLQGRKRAMKMLKSMLQERRAKPRKQKEADFFDGVLDELSREKTLLTEELALDLIFVLLFASYETTSMAMTLAMKFLTDHPLVLQKLTEEHEAILRQRESNGGSELTWAEVKSMTYTFQVVNETLRLANIAPLMFREAIKDVNFMGYTIPAGWVIMVSSSAVHMNPNAYENPLEFNPSRWKGSTGSNTATKNFMAFGGGLRLCAGAEFTKLQMAVFLHYLVTKYRWQVIRGGRTIRTPGLLFPEGFHIRLFERKLSTT